MLLHGYIVVGYRHVIQFLCLLLKRNKTNSLSGFKGLQGSGFPTAPSFGITHTPTKSKFQLLEAWARSKGVQEASKHSLPSPREVSMLTRNPQYPSKIQGPIFTKACAMIMPQQTKTL